MHKNKIKILIIEKSEEVTMKIRNKLNEIPEAAVVVEAANGIEAKAITEIMRPDITILDINLTDSNGMDVISELKKAHSETKVILLSVFPDLSRYKLFTDMGADFIMDKSKNFSDLPDTINYLLNFKNNLAS